MQPLVQVSISKEFWRVRRSIHPFLKRWKHFCSVHVTSGEGMTGQSYLLGICLCLLFGKRLSRLPLQNRLSGAAPKHQFLQCFCLWPTVLCLHGSLLLGCSWKHRRTGVWSSALLTEIKPRHAHQQEGLVSPGLGVAMQPWHLQKSRASPACLPGTVWS